SARFAKSTLLTRLSRRSRLRAAARHNSRPTIRQGKVEDSGVFMEIITSEEINVSESKEPIKETETGAFELTDCGQASQKTQGMPLVLLFELGNPPFNKL